MTLFTYGRRKFVNLLCNNNPNIIENLFVPNDKILLFDRKDKTFMTIGTNS